MPKQAKKNAKKQNKTSKISQEGGKIKDRAIVVRVGRPPHHPRPPFRRRPRGPRGPKTTFVCNIM